MSTSSVEFPLSPLRARGRIFGEPIIPIRILTAQGFRFCDFLVDSGADITLLPCSLAKALGIDLAKCRTSSTLGVEGRGMKTYLAKITVRIGKWESRIRCVIADHDRIPPLLGRLDLFSSYNITFYGRRRSILFQRV